MVEDSSNYSNANLLTNSKLYSMNKEEVVDVIYNEELTLEQLLIVKSISKALGIEKYEKDYVNEMIDDYIDCLESKDEVKEALELFKKYELTNAKLNRKARTLDVELEESPQTFNPQSLKNYNGGSVYGEIKAENISFYLNDFPIID